MMSMFAVALAAAGLSVSNQLGISAGIVTTVGVAAGYPRRRWGNVVWLSPVLLMLAAVFSDTTLVMIGAPIAAVFQVVVFLAVRRRRRPTFNG